MLLFLECSKELFTPCHLPFDQLGIFSRDVPRPDLVTFSIIEVIIVTITDFSDANAPLWGIVKLPPYRMTYSVGTLEFFLKDFFSNRHLAPL